MWTLFAIAQASEIDALALASTLIADGHHERAATVLAEITLPKTSELPRMYTLRGMVALELGDPATAVHDLQQAVALEAEPVTWMVLAAAHLELGQERAALEALDSAGPALDAIPAAWTLRTYSLAALGEHDEAYTVAVEGSSRFPEDASLVGARYTQLATQGLTHEVASDAPSALYAAGADEETWLLLGQALLAAGITDDAQRFGEQARLALPESARARVVLASACLAAERYRCAGEMLAEAAAFDATYAVQASESFRRAGDLDRALYVNGLVIDPTEKARQRLGLLLELEAFAEATALHVRLDRLGLLREDSVAYALAYAHAVSGERSEAEALLTGLSDPGLAQQGAALLATLEDPR